MVEEVEFMAQVEVTEWTWEMVTVFVRVAVEVMVVVLEVVSAETRRGSASARTVVREKRIVRFVVRSDMVFVKYVR